MKVVCVLSREPISAVPELARRAERLGFDAIRFSEITHDPMVCAAAAAVATREVRVGTFTLAFPRSPTVVAYQAWDLQQLSGGRFFLGLGSQVKGHIERRFGVPWTAPGPRMRDYVLALRAVWDSWQNGRPLNCQTQHYRLSLMTPEFNPGPQPHYPIPVYLGGVNRFMCRLAGELADGLMLHSLTSPRYLREVILPNLRAGARRAGRDPAGLEVIGGGFIATGPRPEDVRRAREAYRQRVAFYGSTRTYAPVLELHGLGDLGARLHRLSVEGRWEEMARQVSDEVLNEFVTAATWDELVPLIKERFGGLVTGLTLPMPEGLGPAEEKQLAKVIADLKGL